MTTEQKMYDTALTWFLGLIAAHIAAKEKDGHGLLSHEAEQMYIAAECALLRAINTPSILPWEAV